MAHVIVEKLIGDTAPVIIEADGVFVLIDHGMHPCATADTSRLHLSTVTSLIASITWYECSISLSCSDHGTNE